MSLREDVMDCFGRCNRLSAERSILVRIAEAVNALPFDAHPGLPWCRESFPELDTAMRVYESLKDGKAQPSVGPDKPVN